MLRPVPPLKSASSCSLSDGTVEGEGVSIVGSGVVVYFGFERRRFVALLKLRGGDEGEGEGESSGVGGVGGMITVARRRGRLSAIDLA
jgi:hypothetical protein